MIDVSIDARLAHFSGWRSLDPAGGRAPRPDALAPPGTPVHRALGAIAEAVMAHHPGNLFCDLRALASVLAGSTEPARVEVTERVVRLHALFGQGTTIRFRYVHDFLYGYDWARWVAKAPAERGTIGPYDVVFLDYLERRGHELLGLIERDDAKYSRLHGTGSRNPFVFSREPEAEAAILEALAARGLVPVRAWREGGATDARWDRPFAALREEAAMALGHALTR